MLDQFAVKLMYDAALVTVVESMSGGENVITQFVDASVVATLGAVLEMEAQEISDQITAAFVERNKDNQRLVMAWLLGGENGETVISLGPDVFGEDPPEAA